MSVHTVMTGDETGSELVTFAQQTADILIRNNLNRTQIRTIFTEMRQIETLWDKDEDQGAAAMRRLNMLKPKLAYQTARTSSMEELRKVLSEAIDEVEKAPQAERRLRFQRFVELFEAILAYHRAQGGRN